MLTWSTIAARNAVFRLALLVLSLIAGRVVADDARVDSHRRLLGGQSWSMNRTVLRVMSLLDGRLGLGDDISAAGDAGRDHSSGVDLRFRDDLRAADDGCVG